MFWELIDEILNAVLFVLIGLEVIVVISPRHRRRRLWPSSCTLRRALSPSACR